MAKKYIKYGRERRAMNVDLTASERGLIIALLLQEDHRVNGPNCKGKRDVLHRLFWKLD